MRIGNVTLINLYEAVNEKKLILFNPCDLSKEEIIDNLNRLYIRELLLEKIYLSDEEHKKTLVPGIIIGYDKISGYMLKDYNGFIQSIFYGILGEYKGKKIYFNLFGKSMNGVYFSFNKDNESFVKLKRVLNNELSNYENARRCRSMIYDRAFPVMKTYGEENELKELISK